MTNCSTDVATRAAVAHVLVVDDDPGIRGTIRAILDEEGYTVATASNGCEALVRIAEQRPALVLLDLQMPVMNGWEVLTRVRESGLNIPVVFMTAGLRAHAEAARHHADGALPKPFDLDELLQLVERFTPHS